MKKALHVSRDLALPLDAITQTIVVYGAKGKGKTNFGTVLAEELYANGLKFSALDPYGVMWGLRHGQTKEEAGIEVLIIGGVHGDIGILPTAGAVVADLVSDESISTVVDISRTASGKMWTKGEKVRFVADYATRLFERQGEHQRPLMQIIDEAGRYCPQTWPHGAPEIARCVGAIEELVEVGRNVGIGVTLITQRSARMNKSVSELAECMVAFCTIGPNSVEAILDWCGEHIEKSRWKELVAALRTLPKGTAMMVSPGWLGLEGQAVAIRARSTFDSSATPKAGARKSAPGKAAMPDLGKYRERMEELSREAQASDPRELRRQLQERDRQIAKLTKASESKAGENAKAAAKPSPPERIEVFDEAAFDEVQKAAKAHLSTVFGRFGGIEEAVSTLYESLQDAHRGIQNTLDDYRLKCGENLRKSPAGAKRSRGLHVEIREHQVGDVTDYGLDALPKPLPKVPGSYVRTREDVPPAKQKILNALAFFATLGITEADRTQVALLAGKSPISGGYNNDLGKLRSMGLIAYPSHGKIALTGEGIAIARVEDTATTTEEFHANLAQIVKPARWLILKQLIDVYPHKYERAELADRVGKSPTSGGYNNDLGKLKSFGFITYPSAGYVAAAPCCFLGDD